MADIIPLGRPRVVSPFITETFGYVVLAAGFSAFCLTLWVGAVADAVQRGLHLARGEDQPRPNALIMPPKIASVILLADRRR